jgi:hypothetical protein
MSPEEYSICFKVIDGYARSKHGCFLAEFDATVRAKGSYLCCFRPTGGIVDYDEDDPIRYACKYVTIDAGAIQSIVSDQSLPPTLARSLDEELLNLLRAKS